MTRRPSRKSRPSAKKPIPYSYQIKPNTETKKYDLYDNKGTYVTSYPSQKRAIIGARIRINDDRYEKENYDQQLYSGIIIGGA